MIHSHYPTTAEVDAWCNDLRKTSDGRALTASFVDAPQYQYELGIRHTSGNRYVAFETPERMFYGYWQPASAGPAPVLVHVPGYGGEMSAHPELVAEGFNVLHVNPLGYCTPTGTSDPEHRWTVLPDTVTSHGERGYVDWLSDVAVAVRWAFEQESVDRRRFGFLGSSQGGGTALLLASIFSANAVAADVAFLTNFPLMHGLENRGAYQTAFGAFATPDGDADEWRALGFIDTMSHAHRLSMPALLTAGNTDDVTPPVSIESLFEVLPGTKSYTLLAGQGHAYTMPFLRLAAAWFRTWM